MTQIPKGKTEDEVMVIIDKVANRLARKFRFGYHTIDDMKQQARLVAWEGLDLYDNVRPLENFLWTHVRNRLFNFKRDNSTRPDLPCLKCPLDAYDQHCAKSHNGCTAFEDKSECEVHERWFRRNERKNNILNPIGFVSVIDEHEDNMKVHSDLDQELDMKEFFKLVEGSISLDLKADLIRLRNGITIPKPRREKVYVAIRVILEERGLDEPEAW